MIAVGSSLADLERQQLRHLLGCVPEGMTPDEALEMRMALLRRSERRASRGERIAVWCSALIVDALVFAFVFTPGA